MFFRKTSKILGGQYEVLRSDMLEAGDEATAVAMDKFAGYQPEKEEKVS